MTPEEQLCAAAARRCRRSRAAARAPAALGASASGRRRCSAVAGRRPRRVPRGGATPAVAAPSSTGSRRTSTSPPRRPTPSRTRPSRLRQRGPRLRRQPQGRTPCEPSWGGAYSLDEAAEQLDLDRRVARLASSAAQVDGLLRRRGELRARRRLHRRRPTWRPPTGRWWTATRSTRIDLDIEGDAASAPAVDARRAAAIAQLAAERAAGRDLAVWLTLPVAPTGLTADGPRGARAMLAAQVSTWPASTR